MTYYPIGTVVVLKEGKWPLMIYGRKQKAAKKSDEIWDYLACLYPQGHLGKKYQVLFNHEDIDSVLYDGMASEAEIEMEKLLDLEEDIA